MSEIQRHHLSSFCYPHAEATHEEVYMNRELFLGTHERLLQRLGIKFRIPRVSGIEIDLHLLYCKTCELGGLEAVVNRKQWVNVCEAFNFPSTFTNKSFVIKKLYVNALHHYEQVYFLRNGGKQIVPPLHTACPMLSPIGIAEAMHAVGSLPLPTNHSGSSSELSHKRPRVEGGCESPRPIKTIRSLPSNLPPIPINCTPISPLVSSLHQQQQPAVPCGPPMGLREGIRFNGIIEHSIEHGYMVCITLPGQRFQAALVSSKAMAAVGGGEAPMMMYPLSSFHPLQEMDSSFLAHGTSHRKQRVAEPVPPKSAFDLFFDGIIMDKPMLIQFLPEDVPPTHENLFRAAQSLWDHMNEDQRVTFYDQAANDKKRYDRAIQDYRSSTAEGPSDCMEFSTPSSLPRIVSRIQGTPAYGNNNLVAPPPHPYGHVDPFTPFGLRSNAVPHHSTTSGAMVMGGSRIHEEEDEHALEHVLQCGDDEDDDIALAINALGAATEEDLMKSHIDLFGCSAQVMVGGSGASKGSSLLVDGADKSPMAHTGNGDGISSACTTATLQ